MPGNWSDSLAGDRCAAVEDGSSIVSEISLIFEISPDSSFIVEL